MKRIISLMLVLVTIIALSACGGDGEDKKGTDSVAKATEATGSVAQTEEKTDENVDPGTYKLGDSIETDILRITLTNSQFAIKLNSSSYGTLDEIKSGKTTLDDNYFTAEEYNPETDAGLAYVAPKGHTYVVIEYFAENLDRASVDFDGTFNKALFSVEYDGNVYTGESKYGCESEDGLKWVKYSSTNVLLIAGTSKHLRCYIDIPVDAKDLNDDYVLTLTLPNSKGEFTKFKYNVKADDRKAIGNKEMSLDAAIYSFLKEEGQEYFTKHMNDYIALSGAEISDALSGKRYSIEIKMENGSWEGKFKFQPDSRIEETIPSIGTGYYNNRSWTVNGNNLILDGEDICEVRKVTDGTYLFVKDGKPYAIIK